MTARIAYLNSTFGNYRQLDVRFEADQGIAWYFMNPIPRPCFNPDLLAELKKFQHAVEIINRSALAKGGECPIHYTVLASLVPGVFNLGGDLDLFVHLAKEKNQEELRRYAKACIDVLHPNAVSFDLPVTTISLVQGDALGGGCEAALSSNVIIAERSAQFGLPEILFNLFPGMGAYSLLARRLDAARAEKIITSGRVYSAAEFHEMGLVDVLADDGNGERSVYEYVARHARRRNSYEAIFRARQRHSPITYEELMDIAEIWVSAVMNLEAKDFRVMDRLVKAQDRLSAAALSPADEGRLDAVSVHA